jgi:hypothetical protein
MTKARDLANIISGGFTADDIPNLDASKITTGTITPSDNTVTSAKLADSSVTNAKVNASAAIDYSKLNLTGNIGIADLSATGTKDSTTFLRGDNTFATVSSDYVKLSTSTISADTSSVSFDGHFTSGYDTYIVYGNVQLDANSKIRVRVRKSNSDVTSGNYTYSSYGIASNNSSAETHGSEDTSLRW